MTRFRRIAVPFVLATAVLTSCSATEVKANFSKVFHHELSDQQAEWIANVVNKVTARRPGHHGEHHGDGDHPTTTAAPATTTEAPTTTVAPG